MAYIDGFVLAVPTDNKEKFAKHAELLDALFMEHGALRVMECWGDDVADGETTDFRRAVRAKDDESVVFSWVEWPDRQTRDKAMAVMMSDDFEDPRMDSEANPMPFDGKRLIFGGFTPIVTLGE